jgi:Na+/melibiose symporter-like transporter
MTADIHSRAFTAAYGIAHAGKSLFWHTSELLFAYYLTEACALPPRQMGFIVSASLALSALADLVAGLTLRHRVRSVISAGRAQLLGAVLSGAAFAAFGLSGFVPQGPSRFAFACGTLIAFRLTYALLDNPQNALLSLATTSDAQGARLASVRYIFGGVANIIVAAAFAPLFSSGGVTAESRGFALFALLVALVSVISSYCLWRYLQHFPVKQPGTDTPSTSHRYPAPAPYRICPVVVMLFFVSVAMSVFSRLEPYLAAYGLSSLLQGGVLLTCVAAGNLVSQPFWARVASGSSLLTTLRWSTAWLAAAAAVFGTLIGFGPVSTALAGGLYGWGCGGVLMSLWALAASAGHRNSNPTIIFGALTCASKMALALAAAGVAELLNAMPYRTSAAALTWVLSSMTAAPIIAGVIGLFLSSSVRATLLNRVAAEGSSASIDNV